jgi:hypothetical protein
MASKPAKDKQQPGNFQEVEPCCCAGITYQLPKYT